MDNLTAFWTMLAIILGVVEAATAGLVTVWFTLGALASLIASALGASVFWQIIIFIVEMQSWNFIIIPNPW